MVSPCYSQGCLITIWCRINCSLGDTVKLLFYGEVHMVTDPGQNPLCLINHWLYHSMDKCIYTKTIECLLFLSWSLFTLNQPVVVMLSKTLKAVGGLLWGPALVLMTFYSLGYFHKSCLALISSFFPFLSCLVEWPRQGPWSDSPLKFNGPVWFSMDQCTVNSKRPTI